jgi:hypothetical protein
MAVLGYTANSINFNQRFVRKEFEGKTLTEILGPLQKEAKGDPQKLKQLLGRVETDYHHINQGMRGYRLDVDETARPERLAAVQKAYDAYIRLQVRGLQNFAQFEGASFRGGWYDASMFKEGAQWSDNGFLSSAAKPGSAFDGDTLMVFNNRGGAVQVDTFSMTPSESEVLQMPGSRWHVMRVLDLGNGETVDAVGKSYKRIVFFDQILDA